MGSFFIIFIFDLRPTKSMKFPVSLFLICLTFLFAGISCKTPNKTAKTPIYDDKDTRTREIQYQIKRTFRFPSQGVHATNQFPGARLNDMTMVNDSVFEAIIEPENFPINSSPWYAWKMWADTEKEVRIKFVYPIAKHRYLPKISKDGQNWQRIPFEVDSSKNVSIRLSLSPDTLWIAGQELHTSSHVNQWLEELNARDFVELKTLGYSKLGRPINGFHIGAVHPKYAIILLSRQHPPEVTGYLAMQSFVKTLMSSTELAREFRNKVEIIGIPLMNPDGVDLGHWRHSTGGIDLNRDWEFFRQPETRIVANYLTEYVNENQLTVLLGLDFHSTSKDIFYTIDTSYTAHSHVPDFMEEWLSAIERSISEIPFEQSASIPVRPVSDHWFFNTFQAESCTFEIGDNTDRFLISKKGHISAKLMMELLLEQLPPR